MSHRLEFAIATLAIASTWIAYGIREVAYENPKEFQNGTLLPTMLELQTFGTQLRQLVRGY